MKVISLLQPWASLIAHGYKLIETRSWSTRHRGPIAIHASRSPRHTPETADIFAAAGLEGHAKPFLEALSSWPLGKIIATANLDDVVPVDAPHPRLIGMQFHESKFGDYSPGRFAWLLSNVKRLERPIERRGALSLWEVPDELLKMDGSTTNA